MERRLDLADERGIAIPLVGLFALVLMGFTAFAVDMGWVFLNAGRAQNAADAAALAAVVHMPPRQPDWTSSEAHTVALDVAGENGYVDGVDGVEVRPERVLDEVSREYDYRLQVTVTQQVDTFFMRLFGFDTISVTRSATAEVIPPLRMGGRSDRLGYGYAGDNFYLAINARWTDVQQGDPFNAECDEASSDGLRPNGCLTPNNGIGGHPGWWGPGGGYYYAVDVPEGATTLDVYVFDGTHNDDDAVEAAYEAWIPSIPAEFQPRDNTWQSFGGRTFSRTPPSTITYELFQPDDTPFDPTDNPPFSGGTCRLTFTPLQPPAFGPIGEAKICTVSLAGNSGVYPLKVSTGTGGYANNAYGLRATVGGTTETPAVYGIGSMSLFGNTTASSVFDLIEVTRNYRGKSIRVGLYDAGEATGNSFTTFRTDTGASLTCTYTDHNGVVQSNVSPCRIQMSTGSGALYNKKWLDITFDVANDYDCTGNECWWVVEYDFSATSSAHDRTTWTAEVEGNPVHLVE